MKIVFVSVHIKKSPLSFPLSAALLTSAVKNNSLLSGLYETEITDLYLQDSINEAADKIIKSGADIAGFSVYIWNRYYILKLISKIKKIAPGITVIAGGAEVTADPDFFALQSEIDWIANGEGEEEIVNYLTHLSDGKIFPVNTEKRLSVQNTEKIPSPLIDGTIDISKYDGILWELSRGCPFKCDFCFESRGTDRVRKFPIERIEKELKIIIESGIEQVFVLDPTFNIDRKRAVQILKSIKNTAPDIHFTFEARSEYIDTETARLFSEITCSVQIGLQSSNPEVLNNVNRSLDKADFYNKILLLHEEGCVYGFDIIYGLPGASINTFLDSIDFAFSMVPNHIDIFPLAVLKGTTLYDKADKFNLNYLKSDPYTVVSTPSFSEDDMKKASEIAKGIDLFYNKGKAVSFLGILLENLDISPSDFFISFSEWCRNNLTEGIAKSKEPTETEDRKAILNSQVSFIKDIFSSHEKEDEGILVSDIVSCMTSDEYISEIFDIEAVFNYMDSGVTDLSELVFFTKIE